MDPWILLTSGDFIGAIVAPFTNLLGSWFYALMLFAIIGMIYLRTQNIGITGIVMAITTVSAQLLLPTQFMSVVYAMFVLILTIALFRVLLQH